MRFSLYFHDFYQLWLLLLFKRKTACVTIALKFPGKQTKAARIRMDSTSPSYSERLYERRGGETFDVFTTL